MSRAPSWIERGTIRSGRWATSRLEIASCAVVFARAIAHRRIVIRECGVVSGVSGPTIRRRRAPTFLSMLAEPFGIPEHDHIIVGKEDYASLKGLKPIYRRAQRAARPAEAALQHRRLCDGATGGRHRRDRDRARMRRSAYATNAPELPVS